MTVETALKGIRTLFADACLPVCLSFFIVSSSAAVCTTAPNTPMVYDPGMSVDSGQSYEISWNAVSGADSYEICEATANCFADEICTTVTSTSSIFSHSVTTSTTYYYRVRAVNTCGAGSWSSTRDMVVSAQGGGCTIGAPMVYDPGASVNSGESYSVSWDALSGASSYEICEAADSSFTGAVCTSALTATSKSYSHNVTSDTVYYYRVRASGSCGTSGWSGTRDMSVSGSGGCTTAPATPAISAQATSVAAGQSYEISWNAVSGADSYEICEATANCFADEICTTVTATSNNYSHAPAATTEYHYRVRAVNGCGTSGWSGTTDITVLAMETCTFAISPLGQAFAAEGGSGTVEVTTQTGCNWTARSEVSWITMTAGSDGSGNGTFDFTVSVQAEATSRTGTITVAGQSFVVTQGGASSYSYIGVFRSGKWYLDASGNGTWNSGEDLMYSIGAGGDIPVTGDWNGDGASEIGVFRNGKWYLDYDGSGAWAAGSDLLYTFGSSGDVPVTGDWNGDGVSEIGVFRNGKWYLDYNGSGGWEISADTLYSFGNTGDRPVTGDWDGSGTAKIGVKRGGIWYLDVDGNGAWNAGDEKLYFGNGNDIPVSGDWNMDGSTEIGIYRSGRWYLDVDGNGIWNAGDSLFYFGNSGDVPVTGTW